MAIMKFNLRTGLLGLIAATATLSSQQSDGKDVLVADALSLRSLMFMPRRAWLVKNSVRVGQLFPRSWPSGITSTRVWETPGNRALVNPTPLQRPIFTLSGAETLARPWSHSAEPESSRIQRGAMRPSRNLLARSNRRPYDPEHAPYLVQTEPEKREIQDDANPHSWVQSRLFAPQLVTTNRSNGQADTAAQQQLGHVWTAEAMPVMDDNDADTSFVNEEEDELKALYPNVFLASKLSWEADNERRQREAESENQDNQESEREQLVEDEMLELGLAIEESERSAEFDEVWNNKFEIAAYMSGINPSELKIDAEDRILARDVWLAGNQALAYEIMDRLLHDMEESAVQKAIKNSKATAERANIPSLLQEREAQQDRRRHGWVRFARRSVEDSLKVDDADKLLWMDNLDRESWLNIVNNASASSWRASNRRSTPVIIE